MVTTHEVAAFICHSANDASIAEAACDAIERKGLRCWMPPRDIPPGENWARAILSALSTTPILVLIFSRHASESAQVLHEIERAVAKRLTILMLRIDDTPLTHDLAYFLGNCQVVDARGRRFRSALRQVPSIVQAVLLTQGRAVPGTITTTTTSGRAIKRRLLVAGSVSIGLIGAIALAALILRETANSERATSHTVDLRQLNDYYREHGEFPAQSVLDTMTAPAPAVEAPIGEPIQIALSWQDFGGSGTLTLPGDLNMDFVRVEPGRVQLRENTDPAGGASLGSFSITAGYWIGRVEVTAAQWQAVMMDNHQVTVASTTFEIASLRDLTVPVNNVSWNDCQRFLAKLNSGGAGRFRLPYETEWEFATRATATTTWHFGENEESLGRFAWWAGNSGGSIQSVGRLNPNAWGLFDMHGNVAEWCQDSVGGAERMLRGGAWSTESPLQLSSAHRESADADTVSGSIGFRCVRDL